MFHIHISNNVLVLADFSNGLKGQHTYIYCMFKATSNPYVHIYLPRSEDR